MIALTASGPQQPGKLSRAARGEESCFSVRFVSVAGSRAELVGMAGAGTRRDRREREVCPCPLTSSPPLRVGRADASRVGVGEAAERGAGASVEEGSNRK